MFFSIKINYKWKKPKIISAVSLIRTKLQGIVIGIDLTSMALGLLQSHYLLCWLTKSNNVKICIC